MTFLAPYWLFAASAILVPIAIHLWNKRQGKTVKVGSLRWLEASASTRWSSIKLNDVWLLLLRCLILILLAVALAQPVLVHQPQQSEAKKAIYVGQELLYTSALQPIKPAIDSLLQRGYSLYAYTADFRQITPEAWQQISNRTTDTTLNFSANYWGLLPALSEKYDQPQDSVWLFTSDQQRYFTSDRPENLPENIYWIPIATKATATWLQAAVQTSPDSLLLITGHSTRDGITYNRHSIGKATLSLNLPGKQVLQLQRQNDSLQAVVGNTISKVQVQKEPLQIAILPDEAHKQEARYLKAAIQAISNYTQLTIHLKTDTAAADWVFWLRNAKVPVSLEKQVKQGLKLWVQQGAEPTKLNTSIAGAAGTAIKVHQVSAANQQSSKAAALWTAANSQPILSWQPMGLGRIYTFRSGFSPAWSELGRSAQLPDLLLPLLLPTPAATYDLRALDEQQLMPNQRTEVATAEASKTQREPLVPWVVLVAIILFLMERFIVSRRSKVQS
ncbi:BatA domain-containing protein [Pontibacter sp. MBLB2868]|uniref:BatA domain-containing protein n=1 Tax=Pontibacter sp. MBLB2868 TaxID=3451555 RepID=UPI003F75286F